MGEKSSIYDVSKRQYEILLLIYYKTDFSEEPFETKDLLKKIKCNNDIIFSGIKKLLKEKSVFILDKTFGITELFTIDYDKLAEIIENTDLFEKSLKFIQSRKPGEFKKLGYIFE